MRQAPPEFNLIYITCLIMEVVGLCLLAFSIYLIPYVLFDVVYTVPSFVIAIAWWLDMHQHASIWMYGLVIFFPPFLGGLLCLFESRQLTARIEKQLLGQDDLSLANRVRMQYSETGRSILRVLFFTVLGFLAIWSVAYFI